MRTSLIVVCMGLVAATGTTATGQSASIAGAWVLDGFTGRGPLGFAHERSVCALPARTVHVASPDRPDMPNGEQLTPMGTVEGELRIAQADGRVTIERTFGGSMGGGTYRDDLEPDGPEGTKTNGPVTSRTRARWDRGSLVVDHHLVWRQGSDDVSCDVREVFSLDGADTLSVVATNEAVGTSRQTWVRRR